MIFILFSGLFTASNAQGQQPSTTSTYRYTITGHVPATSVPSNSCPSLAIFPPCRQYPPPTVEEQKTCVFFLYGYYGECSTTLSLDEKCDFVTNQRALQCVLAPDNSHACELDCRNRPAVLIRVAGVLQPTLAPTPLASTTRGLATPAQTTPQTSPTMQSTIQSLAASTVETTLITTTSFLSTITNAASTQQPQQPTTLQKTTQQSTPTESTPMIATTTPPLSTSFRLTLPLTFLSGDGGSGISALQASQSETSQSLLDSSFLESIMFGAEPTAIDNESPLDLALVLGLILVAVVILFGLFVLVLFLRRRFMRKQNNIETGARESDSAYVSLPVVQPVAFPPRFEPTTTKPNTTKPNTTKPMARQANGQNHLPLPILYDTKLPKAPLYSNPVAAVAPVAAVRHEYDLPDTPFVH